MAISSIMGKAVFTQTLSASMSGLKAKLDSTSVQLSSGVKSQDYAGLGSDRSLSLAVRARLDTVSTFTDSIKQVDLRVGIAQTSLSGITKAAADTRGDLDPSAFSIVDGTHTRAQVTALGRLDAVIGLLNADVDGHYLFAGRATNVQPVASLNEIMNGTAAADGFQTIVRERLAADLGPSVLGPSNLTTPTNRGHLTVAAAAASAGPPPVNAQVTLTRDAAATQFGLMVTGRSATGNIAVTNAAGPPAVTTFDVASQPTAGEQLWLSFTNPDGKVSETALTAVDTSLQFKSPVLTDGGNAGAPSTGTTLVRDIQNGGGLANGDTLTIRGQGASFLATINFSTVAASGTAYSAGTHSATVDIEGTSTETMDDMLAKISAAVSDATGAPAVASLGTGADAGKLVIRTSDQVLRVDVGGTAAVKLGLATPEEVLNGGKSLRKEPSPALEPGQYRIGVDANETARNIAVAADAAVIKTVQVQLPVSSAQQAATEFFTGNPVPRVDPNTIPPLGTGVSAAFAAPGSRATVQWYKGEMPMSPTDDARGTMKARIDSAITVEYGGRANETELTNVMKALAAFVATDMSSAGTNATDRYEALTTQTRVNLTGGSGLGPLLNTITEFTTVQMNTKAASERHKLSTGMLQDVRARVEGVDNQELAAMVLQLQTQLDASYRAAVAMKELSIVKYL